MARKKQTEDNEDVLDGGPGGLQDGDEIKSDDEELEEEPEVKLASKVKTSEEQLAEVQQQLTDLRAELAAGRKQPEPAPKIEPEPEPDWEDLMFKNPKEAVRLMKESVRKDIATELRGEYQAARSEDTFWSTFYANNGDLKEDDDLVRATLTKHMTELGGMPVETAAKKLADLTRDRILRYAGGGKRPAGKKVVVEGEGAPKPTKVKEEPTNVVTLSQLIRNRKAKRNKGVAA